MAGGERRDLTVWEKANLHLAKGAPAANGLAFAWECKRTENPARLGNTSPSPARIFSAMATGRGGATRTGSKRTLRTWQWPSCCLVAFTVGRPPKLGFVKDHDDDLIDVGENEDEKAWMPFRDVVYLAIRAAQARTGRQTAVASANGPIVTTGSPLRPRKPASSTTCAVSDAPDLEEVLPRDANASERGQGIQAADDIAAAALSRE